MTTGRFLPESGRQELLGLVKPDIIDSIISDRSITKCSDPERPEYCPLGMRDTDKREFRRHTIDSFQKYFEGAETTLDPFHKGRR